MIGTGLAREARGAAIGRRPDAAGVRTALRKLGAVVPPTPLLPLRLHGRTVWLKCESLQPIGAFKLRGAWHRLTDLSAAERARGVVAFSSGNHAQGVAWAARRLGIAATIVMPQDAPEAKRAGTEALGAAIVSYDRDTQSREAIAAAIAAETGATLVPSFDDPRIVEGQGSAALEAAGQMKALGLEPPDLAVVPCGGGGLAAGAALALPDTATVTVEPAGWDDMARSLAEGAILPVGPNPPPTACDALQTTRVSPITFEVLRTAGARGVAVSEKETAEAQRLAFSTLRLVVEPGGAVALAALITGRVEPTARTLVILSGGNVDAAAFARVIAA